MYDLNNTPETLIRWQPKVVKADNIVVIYNIPPDMQSNAFLTICEITFAVSEKVTTIGRNHNNNFAIKGDMYISSFHAKIFHRDKEYYIIDENSTNGTFINRNPIFKGELYQLHKGDLIQLGVNTVIEFNIFSA
jgi:pSer/pThr/pTyr-binding forkhead associated (FHA) protein